MVTVPGARQRPAQVLPAEPRLAERARAQRSTRRRWFLRRFAEALVVLLPLVALAWVLLVSTWVTVDRVEVMGTSRLTVEEVITAAGVPLATPLARVDLDGVEAAVSRLPAVADVQAHRSWPGTLRLNVTERSPVAGVASAGGVTLVDGEGVPFAVAPELPAGALRLEVAQVGPQDPATLAALQVSRELPAALRSQVQALRAASPSSVVLLLAGGRQVVWGPPGDAVNKAAAVEALLKLPGRVVDVSAPGVAVRRDAP